MLRARNETLASFWLDEQDETALRAPELTGRRVLVVDAEDAFTAMLVVELRALGLEVSLRPYQDFALTDAPDAALLILGPGPGDPRDPEFEKIQIVRRLARRRLADGLPLLGICLGSQITALELGLELVHKTRPFQGTQRSVDFYGRPERVGFYNTYSATAPATLPPGLEIAADADTREVVAFRTPTAAGFQFHPESVLTEHGVDLLRTEIARLLG
jgi:phenazine biosynthesis protein phzE